MNINSFPQMTPEQETQAAGQLLYLIIIFLIVAIVLAVYATFKHWNAKTTARTMSPIIVIFLFVGGAVILRAPWWFVFQVTILAIFAYIGWTVSVPKIRQTFLDLFNKKKKG